MYTSKKTCLFSHNDDVFCFPLTYFQEEEDASKCHKCLFHFSGANKWRKVSACDSYAIFMCRELLHESRKYWLKINSNLIPKSAFQFNQEITEFHWKCNEVENNRTLYPHTISIIKRYWEKTQKKEKKSSDCRCEKRIAEKIERKWGWGQAGCWKIFFVFILITFCFCYFSLSLTRVYSSRLSFSHKNQLFGCVWRLS